MAENTKIQTVELCGAVGKCQASPSGYASALESRYTYTKPSADRVAQYALQQLEAARAADVALHEKNIPLLQHNIAIAQRVHALMQEIGMPESFTERDVHSRARYPKTVKRTAGWLTDLTRECRTDDSFAQATRTYEDLKRRYTEYAERAAREAADAAQVAERQRQQELEKRKADMDLAGILLRYSLPIEFDWGDVLEHLCGLNQRLELAVAMAQTRADWNDGPDRVRQALYSFKIQSDEDKDIAACVSAGLVDFDDGRVFRDMTWNYDALFASVAAENVQLVADVKTALSHKVEG
jgi:phage gp36-like protein